MGKHGPAWYSRFAFWQKEEEVMPLLDIQDVESGQKAVFQEKTKNQLGVINGCYVPCLLNIMGVILFLRLGWSVGQAGVLGTLLFFLVAEIQAIITVLSLSAIVTNGEMKGGGSYYLISRALGPEVGGSLGCLFYAAYAVGATFYVVGFAESVQTTFLDGHYSISTHWLRVMIGSGCLLSILVVSLIGANFFTKVNIILFAIQFGSILIGIIAMLFRSDLKLEHGGYFNGPNGDIFKDNFMWDYTKDSDCDDHKCTFAMIFAIMFPSVTGIMEGANLSGDLKNPHKSIPRGTLGAVFTAWFFYIILTICFGLGFDRHTLVENKYVLQDACWSQYIIVVGICISTLSSGLGAVFGGSRLAQAIARDKLFPFFGFFGTGSKKGDEPRRGVLLTWAIAQACLFVGGIDAIAPIITSFFCLSYGMTNLSCCLLEVSGTPNFRPRFKYYTWWISLFGAALNIGIMFFLNYLYGLISVVALMLIFVFLVFRPSVRRIMWGDVRQALIYHQVRKYLLKMGPSTTHEKLWRPSILLLVDNMNSPLSMFCNKLKRGGLYLIGATLVGDLQECGGEREDIQATWFEFSEAAQLKAFPSISIAPTLRSGVQNLMMLSGLGALQPNTVVVPFVRKEDEPLMVPNNWNNIQKFNHPHCTRNFLSERIDEVEYVTILNDILKLKKNIIIGCNFEQYTQRLNKFLFPTKNLWKRFKNDIKSTVDIWLPPHIKITDWDSLQGSPLLSIQFAYVLNKNNVSLRLFRVMDEFNPKSGKEERDMLVELVKRKARVRIGSAGSEIHVVPTPKRLDIRSSSKYQQPQPTSKLAFWKKNKKVMVPEVPENMVQSELGEEPLEHTMEYYKQLNEIIKKYTTQNTGVCIVPMPIAPPDIEMEEDSGSFDRVEEFISMLEVLVQGLPPTALIKSGDDDTSFISTIL